MGTERGNVMYTIPMDIGETGRFIAKWSLGITGLGIGIQGETGLEGPKGATGFGLNGSQGNTGINGATGVKGIIGDTGVNGIQGDQGNTGVSGLQGITGINGLQGETGLIGEKGATGFGLNGTQGNTGVNGIQGNTGIDGVTGISGLQGVTGIDTQNLKTNRGETGGTLTIPENNLQLFGVVSNATFVLSTPISTDIVNEYKIRFTSGATGLSIAWPSGLSWNSGDTPLVVASKIYEISIIDSLAVFAEY
jgi:hypothetical protein